MTNNSTTTACVLTLEDFTTFMTHVNGKCGGKGCGYDRRDCRKRVVAEWFETWAGKDKARIRKLPIIRRELSNLVPSYFRDYSRNDKIIENPEALAALHVKVVAAIGN